MHRDQPEKMSHWRGRLSASIKVTSGITDMDGMNGMVY